MNTGKQAVPALERSLSLTQATAINMIDMVGIGPFITLPMIVSLMHGTAGILAWCVGAVLAYADGTVWAELGAKWPEAGGSYVFLKNLFGGKGGRWSKLMPFLFIWQTTIQAPLIIASGAIGFSNYFSFLVPLSDWQQKVVSGSLVVLLVMILYRKIESIGRISVALWVVTGGTFVWLIVSGIPLFNFRQAFNIDAHSFTSGLVFSAMLGQASLKAVYSYLGYYNVCHLGAEIKNPARNIPRAIFLSITGIAVFYLLMHTIVLGVMPWQEVAASKFVVSVYFERVYNSHIVGVVATVLILIVAFASLFSATLGYSRIPYSAALNGDFFKIFARVHPRHHIPHISLLGIGAVAFVFSLLFRLGDIISAIIMMRILVQFVMQAVGLIMLHYRKKEEQMPYKMPLFPLPALLSILIWLYIFVSNEPKFIIGALGIIVLGVLIFVLRSFYSNRSGAVAGDGL